jgi:alkanesulfonate monooxygenase SsuD/methylene tetrahydromethanopterin reductase-like flavin-dependent oxidoreductase (luciferase family)
MKYGLELPNAGCCDARTLAELALLAEQAGWDGIFLEDYLVHHHAPDTPTYDPWIALAAMAVRTERIRLGTTVTPLSRRRPWKLARETVTLDHLSHGRLTLGVGLGDLHDPGFAQVGEVTDAKQRARIVDEALEVLVGLWNGAPFSRRAEVFSDSQPHAAANTASTASHSHLGGRQLAEPGTVAACGTLGWFLWRQRACSR